MADDVYAETMERIVEQAFDTADEFRKSLRVYWRGTPYGMRNLTDLEHMVWFEGQMKKDPLWVQALRFVEGGDHELQRYLKTRVRLADRLAELNEL